MPKSIATDAGWTTATADEIEKQVDAVLDWLRPQLVVWAGALMAGNLTPSGFCRSERALWTLLREFGRPFLERLLNAREGDGRFLPHDVVYQGQGYRRLAESRDKKANESAAAE
ncbi:hypothetical protein FJY94_03555 [Candidatus Kaiserbacteria bacterium]|nr:hypothetical protein [Candidatus Kaiserbacteria bacterium]